MPQARDEPRLTSTQTAQSATSELFFANVGHEVPTTLIASPVTSTLAPASALGLIEGICNGTASASRFVGGPLADDVERRRRLTVGGYTAVLSSPIGTCRRTALFAQSRTGEECAQHRRSNNHPSGDALLGAVPAAEVCRFAQVEGCRVDRVMRLVARGRGGTARRDRMTAEYACEGRREELHRSAGYLEVNAEDSGRGRATDRATLGTLDLEDHVGRESTAGLSHYGTFASTELRTGRRESAAGKTSWDGGSGQGGAR